MELMIACAIIAILIMIAIPAYMSARLKADEQKAIVNFNSISQAEKLYWHSRPLSQETYEGLLGNLTDYVEFSENDGDWEYEIDSAGADTFTILAYHLDHNGTRDGMTMTMDQNGFVDYSWK